ncbi:hypothetical protein J5Y04_14765 [Kitasatospora sp. RG8]|uniref:hypothetical protein n=1 Tax=Kitasatospora sp. RG8 TaxID=2820815 RepID=UPI001AE08B4A|nr:hypothetical protein [Kitasatospora sp. RG8]MBP0450798.1 hypothetical protein [Kitasatospora sp. RG8]
MARGFARVDNPGNLISSQGVTGMAKALSDGRPIPFGAYCFKLEFTPLAVVACSVAHPDDNRYGPFGPILYTAGPNISGILTTDDNGSPVECPAGFQDAAVIGRVPSGVGLGIAYGGFYVLFE